MRQYSVNRPRHEIQPEEILMDSMARTASLSPARLESPLNRLYVGLALAGIICFFAGASGIALYYQLGKNAYYAQRANENSLRSVLLQAPRGVITDRYGNILADNKTTYDIVLVSEELPKALGERMSEAASFASLMKADASSTAALFNRAVSTNGIVLAHDVGTDEALVFKARESEFPGMKLVGTFQRVYPFGAALSHVVGYVALQSQQASSTGKTIVQNGLVGKSGIEAQYDGDLQGKTGELLYQVNAKQNIIADQQTAYYEQGDNVQLTLDAPLQQEIYNTLLPLANKYGGGAVGIALDPQNGDVLALTSVPGFDPEQMSSGITQKQYAALMSSPQKPFFSRATSGIYSPGSTIKPFIALAALDEHTIDPSTTIDDTKGYISVPNPYDASRPQIFHDWKAHGFVDMVQAIGDSCDTYFYTVGGGYGNVQGLGVGRITEYLQKFFWERKTGIDIPGEQSGFLPTASWKEQAKHDPWRIGDTYNYSIGQGYVLTTPIDLIAAHAAIANGGTMWQPHLLSSISDPLTHFLINKNEPRQLGTLPQVPGAMDIIHEGMRYTVTNGSAHSMADLPFAVAGKTGSVQTSSSLVNTNALFVAFMPYDHPKISLLILVESGGGGTATAVPAAREILSWYAQNRLLRQ